MSITITKSGFVGYRTKLMLSTDANRFAACLKGNSRFTQINVETSATATRGKNFYVTFHPANVDRQSALYAGEWDKRAAKAAGEGADYIFIKDGWKHWVFNPISEETYEIDSSGCSCPDYVYRASRAGLHCKHQIALSNLREQAIAA